MSKLRDALEEGLGVPDNLIEGAQEAAVKLAILSRKRHMRYLFDDSLPVLDLDAPAIIFATHGMDLPSENDLSTAEMRAQMTLTRKSAMQPMGILRLFLISWRRTMIPVNQFSLSMRQPT